MIVKYLFLQHHYICDVNQRLDFTFVIANTSFLNESPYIATSLMTFVINYSYHKMVEFMVPHY